MLTVEDSIVINRPIEQVSDYVTDIKRMVEWIGPTIESNQTSENPRGVGTTSSRVSQFLGRRIESEMETGFALKVGFDAKVPRLMQKWESYMPNPTPLAVTTRQCS